MLCGVACGWKAVVCFFNCLRLFLVAFFRGCVCIYCIFRWRLDCALMDGFDVCAMLRTCVLGLRWFGFV